MLQGTAFREGHNHDHIQVYEAFAYAEDPLTQEK